MWRVIEIVIVVICEDHGVMVVSIMTSNAITRNVMAPVVRPVGETAAVAMGRAIRSGIAIMAVGIACIAGSMTVSVPVALAITPMMV